MDLYRISGKTVSKQQIDKWVDRILELRSQGLSQNDVAQKLNVDRTFISRLESLGELRKGKGIAVVGFPVANGAALEQICRDYGVDWWLFLNEKERLDFLRLKSGLELFNEIMSILARLRSYDVVVTVGSNKRVQVFEALLDRSIYSMEIGQSPLTNDVVVDVEEFRQIIANLCSSEEKGK